MKWGPKTGEEGPRGHVWLLGAPGGPGSLIFHHSCDLTVFLDSDPSRFFSKPSLRSRNTIFTLGTRGSVISPAELEAPILVPHTAQRGEQRVGGRASLSLGAGL